MSYIQIQQLLFILNISTTVALIVYLFTRMKAFSRALNHTATLTDDLILGGLFALLSVLGNILSGGYLDQYTVEIALISPTVAGLTCGPGPGLIAGVLSGLFAMTGDDLTALPTGICCLCSGVIGSMFYVFYPRRKMHFWTGLLAGGICEAVWYSVLILANYQSLLVRYYIRILMLPSFLVIPAAIGICSAFVHDINAGKEISAAESSDRILQVIQRSMDIKTAGFSEEQKQSLVDTMCSLSELDMVFLLDDGGQIYASGQLYGWDKARCETEFFRVLCEKLDKAQFAPQLGYPLIAGKISSFFEEDSQAKPPRRIGSCNLIATPILMEQKRRSILFAFVKGCEIKNADNLLIAGVGRLVGHQLQQRYWEEQNKLLAEAEYHVLKAQVNPHFLFNTLNAINRLTLSSPEKAQGLISDLAAYYRSTLCTKEELIPLWREMETCELFLSIQKSRFDERLVVDVDIPPKCEELLFPSFSVQPIVENCFKHGFSNTTGEIRIEISAKIEGEAVVLAVRDNGAGFPEEVIRAIRDRTVTPSMGIGLSNINLRLIRLFGEDYGLKLSNLSPGACVVVRVPLAIYKEYTEQ